MLLNFRNKAYFKHDTSVLYTSMLYNREVPQVSFANNHVFASRCLLRWMSGRCGHICLTSNKWRHRDIAQKHKRQSDYVKENITRRSAYIRKRLSETKNVDKAKTRLLVIEEIIQNFVYVHNIYHVQLTEMEEPQQSQS